MKKIKENEAKYVASIIRRMYDKQMNEISEIEIKLHHFTYILLTYIAGVLFIFYNTKDNYNAILNSQSYYFLFGFIVIGIIYFINMLFSIYTYHNKFYNTINDASAFNDFLYNKKMSIVDIIESEINCYITCINNNSSLNHMRNSKLTKIKTHFKYYLLSIIIILIILLTFNT